MPQIFFLFHLQIEFQNNSKRSNLSKLQLVSLVYKSWEHRKYLTLVQVMEGKYKIKEITKSVAWEWYHLDQRNNKKEVITPNIIVVPMLKKVDDTIVGIINNITKGFNIPPVKYNKALS